MLLWVTMSAAMTEPSAKVTAADAVMRRASHIRGWCRRNQNRPDPTGIIKRTGKEDLLVPLPAGLCARLPRALG